MGRWSFSCKSASALPFLLFGAIALEGCSGDEHAPADDPPPGTSASSGGSSSSSGGSSTSSSSSSSASSGGVGVDAGDEAGVDAGKSMMTFFVTSTGNGAKGGDFGGLAGADKKCQDHAAAVGGGDHTWVAYLSAQLPKKVDAKDRIGQGPWTNHAGVVIASSNAALHAKGFNIDDADILDEKGSKAPASESAILTGTAATGDAFQNANCKDWTTNAAAGWCGRANSMTDTTQSNDTWSSSFNCFCGASSSGLKTAQRIYCFAKD